MIAFLRSLIVGFTCHSAFGVLCARLSAAAAPPPSSFAYILQADSFAKSKPAAVERLAACGRAWVVLDAHFSSDVEWTRADLDTIRRRQPGRKNIAYVSIGEAEYFRPYWRMEWGSKGKLAAVAPAWLGTENPEWKGNYRVKYDTL